MILGIDEAGRGPVIGPLVIAGVLVDEEGLKRLIGLGVKDSKKLSPSQRDGLYQGIIAFAITNIVKIQAKELDRLMGRKGLNEIEASHFAKIIEETAPIKAYVDAADVSTGNFELMIRGHLKTMPALVVEHKADETYPVVSAASIVAKVERDREIKALHKIYGDFGSGYPSDPKTDEFLKKCFQKNRSFPECVRRKWKTTARASNFKLEEFY